MPHGDSFHAGEFIGWEGEAPAEPQKSRNRIMDSSRQVAMTAIKAGDTELRRHIRDALPGIHNVRVSARSSDSCVAHGGSAGASPSQSMQSIVPYSMSVPVFHDGAQCSNQLSILIL